MGRPSRQLAREVHAWAEERFGDFVRAEVDAGAYERDRQNTPFSRDLLRAAARIGLASHHAPQDVGGDGASVKEWGLLLEWLGHASSDLAFPVLLGYRQMASDLLAALAAGGPGAPAKDLVARYVVPITRGDCTVSLAYTEGADAFAFRTVARPRGDGHVLSGEKTWVTAGLFADAVITVAASEQGELMAFLVERDDPGVRFVGRDLMGMRSLGVARMVLDDVHVPADRLLIASDALTWAQRFFNERRLTMPCSAIGRIARVFEEGVAELLERIRYRLPVTEMQAVQSRIGQMHVAIETARTVAYDALDRAVAGECDDVWDTTITTSKYFVIQQAEAVTRGLAHILGGAAYDRTQPYERTLRDIQALIQLAGTQATLEVDLGIKAVAAIEQQQIRQRRRG